MRPTSRPTMRPIASPLSDRPSPARAASARVLTVRAMSARASRSALLGALALAGVALGAASAQAQSSCQTDFERLSATRNARIAAVNALQKKGKGKIDPVAACPRLNALVAAENAMVGYMVKNQKWCSISDDIVAQARSGAARTKQVAGQACGIAAKVAKMKAEAMRQARQRAEGGTLAQPARPSLPAGPL